MDNRVFSPAARQLGVRLTTHPHLAPS